MSATVNTTFYKNINGLRAVSIIGVVLYHFFPKFLPNGFLGVDVFFVISGYLITKKIVSALVAENFSLFLFYCARAKRIIPSILVLVISLITFGWFYLIPDAYSLLGKHAFSSLTFLSNQTYMGELNYFSETSINKWLLHTWSLSVEWQFYLIYPLILMALYKTVMPETAKLYVGAMLIIGFYLFLYGDFYSPTYTFYSLVTRFWEMLMGGLAYLYPFKFKKKCFVEVSSLTVILGCMFCFFWSAALSGLLVLAVFCFIQSQRHANGILSHIVFQTLGRWSYSIYLWHWPVRVFLHYYLLPQPWFYVGVLLSIVLGGMNYTFIESLYFKEKKRDKNRSIYVFVVLLLTLMCLTFIIMSDGVKQRFDILRFESQLVMPNRSNGFCFYTPSTNMPVILSSKEAKTKSLNDGVNCFLGDKTKQSSALLFGDSYAGHYEPFLDYIFKKNNASFRSVSTSYCTPSSTGEYRGGNQIDYEQCLFNKHFFNETFKSYQTIFFAGSWGVVRKRGQLEPSKKIILKAARTGAHIFILPAPKYTIDNLTTYFYRGMYLNEWLNLFVLANQDEEASKANEELRQLAKGHDNLWFIERKALFDESGFFEYKGFVVPYYLDRGHLSLLGSIQAAKHFMNGPYYDKFKHVFPQ